MDTETLAKAVETARTRLADVDDLDATIKFDFEGEAAVFVDGNQTPPSVVADPDASSEADCTITASEDVFRELMDGELNPTTAFMTGKLKIDGSMGAAMKLAQVLG